MIRFKVVNLWRQSFPGRALPLKYLKGTVVDSPLPLGVFVFDSLENARNYTRGPSAGDLRIVRVRAHGKGRRRNYCPFLDFFPSKSDVTNHKFFRTQVRVSKKQLCATDVGGVMESQGVELWKCAEGTMTYPSVTVLE